MRGQQRVVDFVGAGPRADDRAAGVDDLCASAVGKRDVELQPLVVPGRLPRACRRIPRLKWVNLMVLQASLKETQGIIDIDNVELPSVDIVVVETPDVVPSEPSENPPDPEPIPPYIQNVLCQLPTFYNPFAPEPIECSRELPQSGRDNDTAISFPNDENNDTVI